MAFTLTFVYFLHYTFKEKKLEHILTFFQLKTDGRDKCSLIYMTMFISKIKCEVYLYNMCAAFENYFFLLILLYIYFSAHLMIETKSIAKLSSN
jgi:hypothetical protein